MIKFVKSMLLKLVMILGILNLLTCPVTFAMGIFAPDSLGVLDPILCPSDMHLIQHQEYRTNEDGDRVVSMTYSCTDGEDEVDATLKMLLIFTFGLPLLGGVLVFFALSSTPSKTPDEAASLEAVEQPEIELGEETDPGSG
jgi:hypothetical protein